MVLTGRALPHRGRGRLRNPAMALRPPPAPRRARLVAVLPAGWMAAGSSVARAAGVADRPGPEWTTLAMTTAVRLMSRR